MIGNGIICKSWFKGVFLYHSQYLYPTACNQVSIFNKIFTIFYTLQISPCLSWDKRQKITILIILITYELKLLVKKLIQLSCTSKFKFYVVSEFQILLNELNFGTSIIYSLLSLSFPFCLFFIFKLNIYEVNNTIF